MAGAADTLALHLGALGDFVLSWPALALLAGDDPAGGLHLWGRSEWCRLILPPDRVHDRESSRFTSLFASSLDDDMAVWLGQFKRGVVFAAAPQEQLLANLGQCLGQVWQVRTRPPAGVIQQVAAWQVSELRAHVLQGEAAPPRCLVDLPIQRSGAVLAPGSGGRAKRLEGHEVSSLAARLAQQHQELTLVLGPAEEPAYRQELAAALEHMPHALMDDASMESLAACLAGAAMYLGADSGVSHLAAALGAPSLVVFKASDPRLWAPWGPRVRVISGDELKTCSLDPPIGPVVVDS